MKENTGTRKKEEQEDLLLAEYCRTRDINLRNELISRYLYIADIISKKFSNRGIEYDDLYQVASLALLKALERYDITKGFKFSSFATPTIVGEIKNYFRDKSRMIRLPRKESEYIKKIENAKTYLSNSLGRSPTPDEIAEYLGITSEQYDKNGIPGLLYRQRRGDRPHGCHWPGREGLPPDRGQGFYCAGNGDPGRSGKKGH